MRPRLPPSEGVPKRGTSPRGGRRTCRGIWRRFGRIEPSSCLQFFSSQENADTISSQSEKRRFKPTLTGGQHEKQWDRCARKFTQACSAACDRLRRRRGPVPAWPIVERHRGGPGRGLPGCDPGRHGLPDDRAGGTPGHLPGRGDPAGDGADQRQGRGVRQGVRQAPAVQGDPLRRPVRPGAHGPARGTDHVLGQRGRGHRGLLQFPGPGAVGRARPVPGAVDLPRRGGQHDLLPGPEVDLRGALARGPSRLHHHEVPRLPRGPGQARQGPENRHRRGEHRPRQGLRRGRESLDQGKPRRLQGGVQRVVPDGGGGFLRHPPAHEGRKRGHLPLRRPPAGLHHDAAAVHADGAAPPDGELRGPRPRGARPQGPGARRRLHLRGALVAQGPALSPGEGVRAGAQEEVPAGAGLLLSRHGIRRRSRPCRLHRVGRVSRPHVDPERAAQGAADRFAPAGPDPAIPGERSGPWPRSSSSRTSRAAKWISSTRRTPGRARWSPASRGNTAWDSTTC